VRSVWPPRTLAHTPTSLCLSDLLIPHDSILQQLHVTPGEPREVRFRVLLRAQVEDGAELQRLEEREVLLRGKPATVDGRLDHGEVLRRDEQLLLLLWWTCATASHASGISAGSETVPAGIERSAPPSLTSVGRHRVAGSDSNSLAV
jgi:hypothetical protein